MTVSLSAAPATALDPVRRFTEGLFDLFPGSLTMLVLRVGLAVPFWFSALTKWDGWFTLSFGAQAQFADLRLHIFGAEYPFPAPEIFALLAALGETVFPILLVSGVLARYAALGLLVMTGIIQLSEPDGWPIHITWAAMQLAVLTFGPGKIALDYVLGLDRSPRLR